MSFALFLAAGELILRFSVCNVYTRCGHRVQQVSFIDVVGIITFQLLIILLAIGRSKLQFPIQLSYSRIRYHCWILSCLFLMYCGRP
jgi:hypothetical protein